MELSCKRLGERWFAQFCFALCSTSDSNNQVSRRLCLHLHGITPSWWHRQLHTAYSFLHLSWPLIPPTKEENIRNSKDRRGRILWSTLPVCDVVVYLVWFIFVAYHLDDDSCVFTTMTMIPPMNGVFQHFPTPKALVRKPDLAGDVEIYSLTWSCREWCWRGEGLLGPVWENGGKGAESLDWLSLMLRLWDWDFQNWVYVPSLLIGGGGLELGLFLYGYGFRCACGDVLTLFCLLLFTLWWVSVSLVSCCWCPCRPILSHVFWGGSHSPCGFEAATKRIKFQRRPPQLFIAGSWPEGNPQERWPENSGWWNIRQDWTKIPCWYKGRNEYPQLTWQELDDDGGFFRITVSHPFGKDDLVDLGISFQCSVAGLSEFARKMDEKQLLRLWESLPQPPPAISGG